MKALKNENTLYVDQITFAITDCYRQNTEPTDAALMTLYSFIGKNICTQGEKAFVVHLAEQLPEQFPMLKGFSPRNLRRMRDFYHTYDNSPSLMAKAQALSWTQNTVILECCETNEQRSFYISLAAEQSLSKLVLVKAIEEKAFEAAKDDETTAQSVTTACTAVSDAVTNQTVDTAQANKTACGAFVTACEPPRQGDGAPIGTNRITTAENRGIPKRQFAMYKAGADQAARRPIYLHQTHMHPFPARADRGKPPNQFPLGSPPAKKKNVLPDGRTHSEFKRQPPHQMAKVA